MFLLNNPVDIEWVLEPTSSTLLYSDLNLVVIDPTGTSTWIASPISPADFTAPTAVDDGEATYNITPDIEGFWRVRLVTGTADSYKILSKVEMQVFDNVTEIQPYSPEIGKPVPYDMQFFAQGFMVAAEVVGQLTVNRDMVLSENDIRNFANCAVAPTISVVTFLIKHNGVQFGTITFDLNDKVGVVLNEYRLLLAGDTIQISTSPGVIDYAFQDLSVTLTACCEVTSCVLL